MNVRRYSQIIGENPPDVTSPEVHQHYSDTCAIKSQQLILEHFGIDVSEEKLIQEAERLDIYAPGEGTRMEDVGKLLELNGVSCTQHQNASILDLTAALAKGEHVIIGVNSGDLWGESPLQSFMDSLRGEQADHALIVAGIDTSDPANPQVILTDPGSGEEGARYPLDQFMDAWQDSGNFMVTTDSPAPLAYNPAQMANFDYDLGHLPFIGSMPFDYFDLVACPLSHLPMDDLAAELYYHDLAQMIDGDISCFSPGFMDAYADFRIANPVMPLPAFDFSASMHEPLPQDDAHAFEPFQHYALAPDDCAPQADHFSGGQAWPEREDNA